MNHESTPPVTTAEAEQAAKDKQLALPIYVAQHTHCQPIPPPPAPRLVPAGFIDLEVFLVRAMLQPTDTPDVLEKLVKDHSGTIACDPLDGGEHNYHEIGIWLGLPNPQRNQEIALRLMALGFVQNLWALMTPHRMTPGLPEQLAVHLSQIGMITIKARRPSVTNNG